MIEFMKTHPDVKTPTRATDGSAGYDLALDNPVGTSIAVKPGAVKMAHTGICIAIPDGWVGLVFIRSSVGRRRQVGLANQVGVIDSDYRGEILLPLMNYGQEVQVFDDKERIAQLVIVPYKAAALAEVEQMEDTARGAGGFGSTGR